MIVEKYVQIAHATDRLPKNDPLANINPRLGLAGEIGSLLTQLKKEVRGRAETADATRQAIKDELGDILWYAVTIARRSKLNFQREVLYLNLTRLVNAHARIEMFRAFSSEELRPGGRVATALKRRGSDAVKTFDAYQALAILASRYRNDKAALVPYLVQIWKNSGELLSSHLKWLNGEEENNLAVAKSLGDVMWYVAGFANLYGLSLSDIAAENLEKIMSAFPSEKQKKPTPLYDNEFGPLERFPRQFNVDFVPQAGDVAVMLINGVRVGDPLRDNAYKTGGLRSAIIDGYRFHDSIHLAFVAVLGWSPVMRNLLMRKRKSKPELDDAEDGARARIVEEMVAKIAHTHAVGHDKEKLFDGKRHLNLNLLKDIVKLAEGLEVAGSRPGHPACKFWEWERAILEGFRIYNLLRRHNGGRISVDLKARSVAFMRLKSGEGTRLPLSPP